MGRGSGLWVPRQPQWAKAEPISLVCGAGVQIQFRRGGKHWNKV